MKNHSLQPLWSDVGEGGWNWGWGVKGWSALLSMGSVLCAQVGFTLSEDSVGLLTVVCCAYGWNALWAGYCPFTC